MNKLSTAIMACTLALTFPMTGLAANAPKNGLTATHQEYHITGNKIVIKLQPKVINNVTMVPARAVFEALGFTVKWDEKRRHSMLKTEREKLISLLEQTVFLPIALIPLV